MKSLLRSSLLAVVLLMAANAQADYKSCYRWDFTYPWVCDLSVNKELSLDYAYRLCRRDHYWFTCKTMEYRTEYIPSAVSQPSLATYTPTMGTAQPTAAQPAGAQPTLHLKLSSSARVLVGEVKRLDGMTSSTDQRDFGGEQALAASEILKALRSGQVYAMKIKSFQTRQFMDFNEEEINEIKFVADDVEFRGVTPLQTRDDEHAAEMAQRLARNENLSCLVESLTVLVEVQGEVATSRLQVNRMSCH